MHSTVDTRGVLGLVPDLTWDWLLEPENPAVAVLTSRTLLGAPDNAEIERLWESRNSYEPVARILGAQRSDGSWDTPARDYAKYAGSLWQVIFLGELHANGADERVERAASYAFSRQLEDGSWSCMNGRAAGSLPCLTANVARGLARLGFERDERVIAAVRYCVDLYRALGTIDCVSGAEYQLNGYCHMLTPKLLLLLGAVPQDVWPEGASELRDECVDRLRDKAIFRSLPAEAREFTNVVWSAPADERHGLREQFLAEHPELHYADKPGWLRFGFPLSYNSDALEALRALAGVGEGARSEYETALKIVRDAADDQMRWKMRNTHNGKMIADIEAKGAPSKWITLHALQALVHFEA